MSSIRRWVGPNLPRWMARFSGAALILVGLLGPAWMTQSGHSNNNHRFVLPVQPVVSAEPQAQVALTPPMGWNGFNRFVHEVTEARVESEARMLVASGMQSAGYEYVNLDGGWDLFARGQNGELVPDPNKFPRGIKPVADYVHSLGLKFGIYTSAGIYNCAKTSAGSYGHYQQDAAMFAAWGVDYVKFDWCYIPFRLYKSLSQRQVGQLLAAEMSDALAATGRPMIYDINDPWTVDETWTWAPKLAHMWRTAQDSKDRFPSLLQNFTHNVAHFSGARPGNWNDPDMLEVGNGGMTETEYQAQFSLWAEMAAPLIAGNDLSSMSDETRSILTNQAVIAVDQDRLGRQGYPIASSHGQWVLVKPLAGGDRAIVLFNSTDRPAAISTTAAKVGLNGWSRYELYDLWTGATIQSGGMIAATVPPHGVAMFIVSTLRFASA